MAKPIVYFWSDYHRRGILAAFKYVRNNWPNTSEKTDKGTRVIKRV
jgi:hypothetical protein